MVTQRNISSVAFLLRQELRRLTKWNVVVEDIPEARDGHLHMHKIITKNDV